MAIPDSTVQWCPWTVGMGHLLTKWSKQLGAGTIVLVLDRFPLRSWRVAQLWWASERSGQSPGRLAVASGDLAGWPDGARMTSVVVIRGEPFAWA